MIFLDTNVVITFFNSPLCRLGIRMTEALTAGSPLAVSSVVLFELWYGTAKSKQIQQNSDRIRDFLSAPIEVIAFDADDAREAGDIRAALERVGKPIGPYDVLIAAQARRRRALLVTANEREFERVPGLRTEDWAA